MKLRRRRRVILALGAGGARGLAHIGVIRALRQGEVPIEGIAGVSFGAIVGGLYALYGDIDEVERRLRDYMQSPLFQETRRGMGLVEEGETSRGFFDRLQATLKKGYFFTMALSRQSLVTPEDFVYHMHELVGDADFRDLRLPFACLSVDLVTGNPIVFAEGDLCTALQASCAAPGFFPPVGLHGMLLVDGGVAEMIPVNLARTLKPDYLVGVDGTRSVDPLDGQGQELHHSLDVVFRSYDITREFMNVYMTREIDCVIRPDIGAYSWADFEYFDRYVEEGARAARARVRRIRRDVYWLNT